MHPDGMRYRWFPPGVAPDREGRKAWVSDYNSEIPSALELPLLPEKWLNYLSQGKIAASSDRIDMDSSVDKIYAWCDETFHDGDMCDLMRKKLELHKQSISESSTSHDKLVNAHWNLVCLAMEGHTGWLDAVNKIEDFFVKVVQDREKRTLSEVQGEVFRSRMQALRKVKGKLTNESPSGQLSLIRVAPK